MVPTVPAFLRHVADLHGDRAFVVTPTERVLFRGDRGRSPSSRRCFCWKPGWSRAPVSAFRYGNGPEWLTLWLALARIGCIAMPLSTMYRPAELRQVLALSDAQILVTPLQLLGARQDAFLEETLPGLAEAEASPLHLAASPFLRRVYMVGQYLPRWAEPLPEAHADWADDEFLALVEAQVHPSDPLLVIFTSGTTSEPKAIIHSHGTWVRHTKNYADNTGEQFGARLFAGMPFFWVGGVSMLVGTAMHRAQTLLCSESSDPDVIAELLVREGAERVLQDHLSDRVLGVLRSGRWRPEELPPFARPAAASPAADARRGQSLGMTETCAAYIVSGPADHVIPEEYAGAHGLRVPHMEYQIIDPDTGTVLAEGEEGEICVRGYSLMLGMHKKERHEYLDADGWYRTGDRGRLRGPYIYFAGRIKALIKSAGANVSPREVEAVLNACDGVLMSVVVGLPDALRGELVGAAVVPTSSAHLDEGPLRGGLCRQSVVDKVPRRLLIVSVDELPLLATGKPDLTGVQSLLTRSSAGHPLTVARGDSPPPEPPARPGVVVRASPPPRAWSMSGSPDRSYARCQRPRR